MKSILDSTMNTRFLIAGETRYIRSDVPSEITAEEILLLKQLGIRTVIDLRTDEERNERPCPMEKDRTFRYLKMPVFGGNTVPASVEDVLDSYLRMCDEQMVSILRVLLEAEDGVIYFCNAGKDRTGVVSALLLKKLGYGDDKVIADYMMSAENLAPRLKFFLARHPQVSPETVTPREEIITEFLHRYEQGLIPV